MPDRLVSVWLFVEQRVAWVSAHQADAIIEAGLGELRSETTTATGGEIR